MRQRWTYCRCSRGTDTGGGVTTLGWYRTVSPQTHTHTRGPRGGGGGAGASTAALGLDVLCCQDGGVSHGGRLGVFNAQRFLLGDTAESGRPWL
jgi:hypothetical protein